MVRFNLTRLMTWWTREMDKIHRKCRLTIVISTSTWSSIAIWLRAWNTSCNFESLFFTPLNSLCLDKSGVGCWWSDMHGATDSEGASKSWWRPIIMIRIYRTQKDFKVAETWLRPATERTGTYLYCRGFLHNWLRSIVLRKRRRGYSLRSIRIGIPRTASVAWKTASNILSPEWPLESPIYHCHMWSSAEASISRRLAPQLTETALPLNTCSYTSRGCPSYRELLWLWLPTSALRFYACIFSTTIY